MAVVKISSGAAIQAACPEFYSNITIFMAFKMLDIILP
jgi:hypothetical protein